VKGPRKPSAAKRGSPSVLPGGAPRELGLAKRPPQRPASWSWVAELKSLGERGGSLIGAAYALAAGSVMHKIEQLDDLNAERRLGRRSQTARAVGAPAAGLTASKKSLQPAR
jgi:hypothetical protein